MRGARSNPLLRMSAVMSATAPMPLRAQRKRSIYGSAREKSFRTSRLSTTGFMRNEARSDVHIGSDLTINT